MEVKRKDDSVKSLWNGCARSALILAGLLVAVPAAAQTSPAADREGPDQIIGLEDVVVTAQRRVESAQKAAIAITVIQPDMLADVTSVQELTKLAPALQFSNSTGTIPIFYVRGVGTAQANPYTDVDVAVNYDNVYLGRPTSFQGLFYDLERVEVLKGPQGTLYGRNATGGVLNIVPAKPELGANTVVGSLSVGNYEAVNAQVGVNLPLSENSALRLSGISYSHDGYNSDGTYSEKGTGGRVQYLFRPNADWSLRLAGDYFHQGGTNAQAVPMGTTGPGKVFIPSGLDPSIGPLDPRTTQYLNGIIAQPANAPFGAIPRPRGADNQYYGVSAEINTDLGFADLVVIPAWRRVKRDEGTAAGLTSQNNVETDNQYSLEARLSGDVRNFDWLLGGFYFDESVKSSQALGGPFLAVTQVLNDYSTRSHAGFGRLTWHLTDRLRLSGSARYTSDRKTFDGVSSSAVGICVRNNPATGLCLNPARLTSDWTSIAEAMADIGFVSFPGAGPVTYVDPTFSSGTIYATGGTVVKSKDSWSKLTWRAGAEFDAGPQSLLYATVETGYRSGGITFSTFAPTYKPENITAYTLGAKSRFWDNRFQFNVEAFIWRFKDQQVGIFEVAPGGGGAQELVTRNIGRSTNKGVEVEAVFKPFPDTTLRADLQYLHARNDNYKFDQVGLPPTLNCPAQYMPATNSTRVDCSGTIPFRAPTWTLNLGAEQSVHLTDDLKLTGSVATHYQTKMIVDDTRQVGAEQPSYWQSDLSLSLSSIKDRWAITGFVNNVEDVRVANTRLNGNLFTSGTYSPPRTYGVRLSVALGQ